MNLQKTITPIDNSIYLKRELASDSKINSVIDTASTSFEIWKNTSLDDRINIVNKFIDNLIDLKDKISKEICWQIGRPISQCAGELRGFEERSRHMVDIAKDSLQNLPATQNEEFDNYIYKTPLGVIFVMAPWNYPIITATNTIVPAIISGNSLILKHSSQTPRCAELIFQAFENTGIPEGVFQFIVENELELSQKSIDVHREALEKKVILVPPTLLLVFYSTIRNAVDTFNLQNKAQDLIELHKKFIKQCISQNIA